MPNFPVDMKPMPGKSPYKPDIAVQAEEEPINLRKFLFSMDAMFSEEFIEDAGWEVGDWFYDHTRKTIALQYKSWLYGEHLKTQVIYFPSNWFEYLRATILPDFILDRWPIKLRKEKVDIRALYPQLRKKLEHPGEKHVIHGVINREDEEE